MKKNGSLEEVVEDLANQAVMANNTLAAMQLSQAALNIAHAAATVQRIKTDTVSSPVCSNSPDK